MKTLAFLITLSLATPALAADEPQPGTPAQLCRSYSAQTPSGLLRLLKPAIRLAVQERAENGKPARGAETNALQCIAGTLPALRDAVVRTCLFAEDPTAGLTVALGPGVEHCLTETAGKPVNIFPPADATPNDPNAVERDPSAPPALQGKGLLPYLGLEK